MARIYEKIIVVVNQIFYWHRALLLILMVMVSACSGSQNREGKEKKSNEIPLETYIEINRSLVEQEQKRIEDFVEEKNLEMEKTGTGLWYQIDKPGNGNNIVKGQVVTIDYQVNLLDGTLCYDSDELGPKTFKVGQGGVESGLEEGVLLLKEGASARFILPPHLAYGLVGDNHRIPARAIIIYDVEVLEVESQ